MGLLLGWLLLHNSRILPFPLPHLGRYKKLKELTTLDELWKDPGFERWVELQRVLVELGSLPRDRKQHLLDIKLLWENDNSDEEDSKSDEKEGSNSDEKANEEEDKADAKPAADKDEEMEDCDGAEKDKANNKEDTTPKGSKDDDEDPEGFDGVVAL